MNFLLERKLPPKLKKNQPSFFCSASVGIMMLMMLLVVICWMRVSASQTAEITEPDFKYRDERLSSTLNIPNAINFYPRAPNAPVATPTATTPTMKTPTSAPTVASPTFAPTVAIPTSAPTSYTLESARLISITDIGNSNSICMYIEKKNFDFQFFDLIIVVGDSFKLILLSSKTYILSQISENFLNSKELCQKCFGTSLASISKDSALIGSPFSGKVNLKYGIRFCIYFSGLGGLL